MSIKAVKNVENLIQTSDEDKIDILNGSVDSQETDNIIPFKGYKQ